MVTANRTKDDRIKELEAYARRLRNELKKEESKQAFVAPPLPAGIEKQLQNISKNVFIIGLVMLFWTFGGFLFTVITVAEMASRSMP